MSELEHPPSWRLGLVLTVLMLAFAGTGARAVYLHVYEQDFLQRQGDARMVRVEEIAAHRGMIRDRRNNPVAVSTPMESIWAVPKELIQAQDRWQELSALLDVPHQNIKDSIFANHDKQFIYLRRHLSPQQAEQVLQLDLPGVYSTTEYRRFYPAAEVAGHVVGITNIDDKGQEGLELAFDSSLRGVPGKIRVLKDRKRRVIQNLDIIEQQQAGEDLELSIDLRIQHLAYRELVRSLKLNRADSGSLVVLDATTGEILALVNQPSFNPNNRQKLDPRNLRNRAVTDLFEPGSTVKPFTVLAALESGEYKPHSLVNTSPGTMRIGKKLVRDHRNYGVLSIEKILTKSSNVGTSKLALRLPPEHMRSVFNRVGLGTLTGSEYPGESVGVLPVRDRWHDIERATLSYGYGLSVTALQLAQAYSVLAAEGVKRPLTMLKHDSKRFPGEQVVKSQHAKEVLHMLESVVSDDGTASRGKVPGYRIAGKTGTVHKLTREGYSEDNYVALFAGIAPVSNPKFVTVVVINNPRGEDYYGGLVAAPVYARIMSRVLPLYNIIPDDLDLTLAEGNPGRSNIGQSHAGA